MLPFLSSTVVEIGAPYVVPPRNTRAVRVWMPSSSLFVGQTNEYGVTYSKWRYDSSRANSMAPQTVPVHDAEMVCSPLSGAPAPGTLRHKVPPPDSPQAVSARAGDGVVTSPRLRSIVATLKIAILRISNMPCDPSTIDFASRVVAVGDLPT